MMNHYELQNTFSDEQLQNIWFVQLIAAQLGIITHQQLYNTAIDNMATL